MDGKYEKGSVQDEFLTTLRKFYFIFNIQSQLCYSRAWLFALAEFLFQWDTLQDTLQVRPFRIGVAKVTEMLGALIVFFNGCQSMKLLFQTNKMPRNGTEILEMCLPRVGEFPDPEPLTFGDIPKAKPIRVLSPKFLQNLAYYLMHGLLPTKSTKLFLEGNIRDRSEVTSFDIFLMSLYVSCCLCMSLAVFVCLLLSLYVF
jgi:hypothetical protein